MSPRDPRYGRGVDRSGSFLGLSALLTGFGQVTLVGTGVADTYLQTLEAVLPGAVLDELLAAYERLPDGDGREEAAAAILEDATLGPVARNLIVLWYCGSWSALPKEWRDAHGASPLDTDRVVSGEGYITGLQWLAAGAHAVGARQEGFGSWALAPREASA